MTDIALLRESPGHVIWIRRALVVSQVAAHACRVGQVVVPVDVAIAALQFQVPSCQRKPTLRMVERRRLPSRGAMAYRAVSRKACRHVVRIRCALVILQVAAHASRVGQVVVPVNVAIATLQPGMRARDGETHCGVIEARGLPCGRVVAVLTCLREPKRDVIRVGSLAKIRQVATHTVGWRSLVSSAHMATRAIKRGMGPGKGKPGNFQVVEASTEPGRDRMALLTSARESGGDVVGRRCLLIGRRVTGVALER